MGCPSPPIPMDRHTHTIENITFPQFLWLTVIILKISTNILNLDYCLMLLVDNGEVQAAVVGFEMEDETVENNYNERNREEFGATAF